MEPTEPAENTLPVPTPTPTPTAAANSEPPKHPQRILLVEDDDALANVYVSRLQAEGFDVRRVKNGEDALATTLSYKPDLIILDVMMPKVSGFDVLDILRNTPETANTKIIMLTALSQPSDQERAKALGVDDYLVKSQVVIADVIESIRRHLNN
jgi:DNA-binding response OmpR family regulator